MQRDEQGWVSDDGHWRWRADKGQWVQAAPLDLFGRSPDAPSTDSVVDRPTLVKPGPTRIVDAVHKPATAAASMMSVAATWLTLGVIVGVVLALVCYRAGVWPFDSLEVTP